MALNISAWSIRNPLPSIVFSIILLVLGWVSFTKLAVTRLPSADIPVISTAPLRPSLAGIPPAAGWFACTSIVISTSPSENRIPVDVSKLALALATRL